MLRTYTLVGPAYPFVPVEQDIHDSTHVRDVWNQWNDNLEMMFGPHENLEMFLQAELYLNQFSPVTDPAPHLYTFGDVWARIEEEGPEHLLQFRAPDAYKTIELRFFDDESEEEIEVDGPLEEGGYDTDD